MEVYNTLIIGSGYFSVGYAAACPGTVICEEQQICDTGFYLPLRSFGYRHYVPKTEEGQRLLRAFSSLSLFGQEQQNTNGFEFAFCKYLAERPVQLLLKCRVIYVNRRPDGVYDVTVQTNEGLTHLLAREILDTRDRAVAPYITVLFVCRSIDTVRERLCGAFDGAHVEPAFYAGRYALHIPAHVTDENRIKLAIYEKWRALDVDAKILYMAPVRYGTAGPEPTCDGYYENPIEAFEAGYLYGKERNR